MNFLIIGNMRKIISILVFVGLFGCDKDNEIKNYHFEIKNSSDKNVIIKTYASYLPNELQKTIIINAGDTYKEIIEEYGSNSPSFSEFLKGDSIVITYQDLNKEIFTCFQTNLNNGCSELRNILTQYDNSILDSNNTLRSYTITQADYDNAND